LKTGRFRRARAGAVLAVSVIAAGLSACNHGDDDLLPAGGSGGQGVTGGSSTGGTIASGGSEASGGSLGGTSNGVGGMGDGGSAGAVEATGGSASGGNSSGGAAAGGGENGPCDVEVDTAAGDADFAAYCEGCTRTKINQPTWAPTGVVVAAGTVGSDAQPSLGIDWISSLVQPRHAYNAIDNIFLPNVKHCPPYASELHDSMVEVGFVATQSLTVSQFTAPGGVWVMFLLVPTNDATTGSSFEFDDGPILPNGLFPMTSDGDLLREGQIYDPNFDSSVPGYADLTSPIAVDGASHAPFFFGGNSSWGPSGVDAAGSYVMKVVVTDATGAGWEIHVPFVVEEGDPGGGSGGSPPICPLAIGCG
jgi:hypothetical protein